jgi:hypothetical protein
MTQQFEIGFDRLLDQYLGDLMASHGPKATLAEVVVGRRIWQAARQGDGLTVAEVARLIDVPYSTAHRICERLRARWKLSVQADANDARKRVYLCDPHRNPAAPSAASRRWLRALIEAPEGGRE